MPEQVSGERRSWLSPANCTCGWDTALLLVVVGTAIYLLARSVFDVIFWVVISICIVYGLVYSYFRCCASSSSSRGRQAASNLGSYAPLPA